MRRCLRTVSLRTTRDWKGCALRHISFQTVYFTHKEVFSHNHQAAGFWGEWTFHGREIWSLRIVLFLFKYPRFPSLCWGATWPPTRRRTKHYVQSCRSNGFTKEACFTANTQKSFLKPSDIRIWRK